MQTVVNITQHLRNYECAKICTGSSNERETNISSVFDKPFERDAFRFNPFSTFRETTFERVRMHFLSAAKFARSYPQKTQLESLYKLSAMQFAPCPRTVVFAKEFIYSLSKGDNIL